MRTTSGPGARTTSRIEPASAGTTCALPDGGTLENTGGKRNQAMLAADANFHF
ncbi:MAG: hypothetical protein ABSF96_07190 [Steroidobacteraceae bacterium]|jgi:hypothetical protein